MAARAYYNEIDPYAAAWLRNLIVAGRIAPGEVDERSIINVKPEDLVGYTQCHFFAGIGVWSYALRLAGWSDDRPVWTGSCPCQPFSAAGKRGGITDDRHLWPEFFRLIDANRPVAVFGEQVASKDGLAWLDAVQTDLERADYAFGAADLCAAGFGAPHIRQRLFFVADASGTRAGRDPGATLGAETRGGRTRSTDGKHSGYAPIPDSAACELADRAANGRGEERSNTGRLAAGNLAEGRTTGLESSSRVSELENTECPEGARFGQYCGARVRFKEAAGFTRSGGTRGWWREADWLWCTDQKYRPVEPGTFPLAHGAPARVGRLRAYGNAIVAPVAAEFIAAYMECRP